MKLCKKIYKDETKFRVFYFDKETGEYHNPNGPAEIYLDDENKIVQFFYKEKGKAKNRKKGPVYVDLRRYIAQWGVMTNLCVKVYYKDLSIRSIETYHNFRRKSYKLYNIGDYFDNFENEVNIAQKWI